MYTCSGEEKDTARPFLPAFPCAREEGGREEREVVEEVKEGEVVEAAGAAVLLSASPDRRQSFPANPGLLPPGLAASTRDV